MGLTVVMLAYHEAENLKWFLPELRKVVDTIGIERVEYLIVDSAKPTDDTAEVCQMYGARYVNQEEPGYGGAFRTAIRCASEEMFLLLDADASQDYTQIPQMYHQFIQGADIVIGSRYIPGGKTDDAKSSQIMSHVLNFVFRRAIGVEAHDLSGSFRIYRTADLRQLHLTRENFEILEEVILKLKLQKDGELQIKEVPISFKKRIIGESKRSLLKFIACFARLLVYTCVLRMLARSGYDEPEKQDARAWKTTDAVLYGMASIATIALNVLVYGLLWFGLGAVTADVLGWVFAIAFAFVINKAIVLNRWDWSLAALRREFLRCAGIWLLLGAVDLAIVVVATACMALNPWAAKAAGFIVIIALNCILGRRFIDK